MIDWPTQRFRPPPKTSRFSDFVSLRRLRAAPWAIASALALVGSPAFGDDRTEGAAADQTTPVTNPWHMPSAPPASPPGSPRASTGWGSPAPPPAPAQTDSGWAPPAGASAYGQPSGYGAPPGYGGPAAYYQPGYGPYVPPASTDGQQSGPDRADDGKSDPPYFDLAAATYVPLSIGAQASLELPARLLAQLDVGWMPGMYGSAINGLVQELGAYDGTIGDFVDGALDGAFVLRLSGGWRPFPDAGFEIVGGYSYISVSGSASPSELSALVGGGYERSLAAAGITDDISLHSDLHNFHVALGWRWVAFEHLVIRANVGYLQTVGSSASVQVPGNPELEALANPIVDETLNDIYTSYVKLPVLGLSGGYRF